MSFSDCISSVPRVKYLSKLNFTEDIMKDLEGKIALVTGASRGLGRGIAEVLAEKGASVIANYRTDTAHAQSICDEIRAKGGTAVPFQADVGKAEEVKKLFDFVKSEFGRLDILVNNAGTTKAHERQERDCSRRHDGGE